MRGIKTEGPMAPEIDMSNQRKGDYDIHEDHVDEMMKQEAAE